MKKLLSIITSFALAVGLMVPSLAFADDGIGTIAIDYNGQRINLKPQVDEAAHSLMIQFQVQTDDTRYQSYVSAGFALSNDARNARIAQSNTSGSTVTAVLSNGESPLQFNNNTLFLGTLSVNVNAKLGEGASNGARIVVTQMDSTDSTFGAPFSHATDTRDETGELLSAESRSVPFSLATSAYTGSGVPGAGTPSLGSIDPQFINVDSGGVDVGFGLLSEDVSLADGDKAALQAFGADLIEKVRAQIDEMLAGNGIYPGFTSEQLQKIAEVIEAAGGNLNDIDIAVTPSAIELDPDEIGSDIAEMDKKFSGATMLSVYDLSVTFEASYKDVTTGPLEVTQLTEAINFTLPVPEGTLSTMNAAVGYMHDGQAYSIDKGVKPILQSSTVQFPATQFSIYAVYGKEKSVMPASGPSGSIVPVEGAAPALIIGFGCLALIACIGAYITIRRRKAQQAA